MRHYYDITSLKRNGLTIPAPGVSITVFKQGTTTLAALFSDDGITAATNPLTSDANGRFDFYVANGRYDLAFSGPGVNSFTQLNVEITDAMDLTTLGQTPITFTAHNSFATGGLTLPSGTATPATCTVGDAFFNTTTGTLLTCTSPNVFSGLGGLTGTGVPVGNVNALQKNAGSGNFAGSNLSDDGTNLSLSINTRFKGPNPYVDVTAFGARAVNPNTTPAATGLTATCTNTLTTVTISSASTFVNGDGVILYGCGAPHSMATPTIASVTPSVDLAGTTTLQSTPGPTGATTYNYKMIARDRNGGLTAASAVVSTTTGAASLGAVSVNLTSQTRSGRTVTNITASAHGFLVGCSTTTCGEVFIGAGGTDNTFRGWFTVTSAVDSTHFTYVGGPDTALGASTSSTGGTANWFSHNKVCASSLPTGAVELYLLSDRANPGTYAVVGAGYPNSTGGTQDICIQDYGSPMMDNQAFPPFVTAAAPWASATSDHLSTTIASGAGTTTLTLANAAGTNVSGATIRLDAAPGILAAVAQYRLTGGTVLIPVDLNGNPFVINSWLNTNTGSTSQVPFAQNGSLYLNDTFEISVNSGTGGNRYTGDVLPNVGGSVPPGAWGLYPHVTVNTAHPGFWFSGGTGQHSLHVSGLNMDTTPVNGSVLMVAEGGFNQTFDHINFQSGSGVNDYTSMGLMLKGAPGQSNSNVTLDFVNFAPGGGSDGVSHTPTVWCRSCGGVFIPHSYAVHRGMVFTGGSGPIMGVGGIAYINGGGTPLLTVSPASAGGLAVIGSVVLDTIAHPCVTGLSNTFGQTSVTFLNGSCTPSSSVLGVSGNTGSIQGISSSTYSSFGNTSGQLGATVSGVTVTQNMLNGGGTVIDPVSSVFIRVNPPAAPTSCTVSAGGAISVAAHTAALAYVWYGGLASPVGDRGDAPGPTCAYTTTTGNQTVTINFPAAPAGLKGWMLYTDGSMFSAVPDVPAAIPMFPANTTSVVISHAFASFAGPATGLQFSGGPTMLLPGTQGIAAPAALVGSGGVQSTGTLNITGTGACATFSATAGGAWAGSATCSGTTGAATVTITPGGTAPHFWLCFGSDITHLVTGTQSGFSSTACTISFTSVTSSDNIAIAAFAY